MFCRCIPAEFGRALTPVVGQQWVLIQVHTGPIALEWLSP